jgi:hypothetical protein
MRNSHIPAALAHANRVAPRKDTRWTKAFIREMDRLVALHDESKEPVPYEPKEPVISQQSALLQTILDANRFSRVTPDSASQAESVSESARELGNE